MLIIFVAAVHGVKVADVCRCGGNIHGIPLDHHVGARIAFGSSSSLLIAKMRRGVVVVISRQEGDFGCELAAVGVGGVRGGGGIIALERVGRSVRRR